MKNIVSSAKSALSNIGSAIKGALSSARNFLSTSTTQKVGNAGSLSVPQLTSKIANSVSSNFNNTSSAQSYGESQRAEMNEYNQEAEQRSYDYTRSLRKTAYQDTVSDMIAAGINPILAAQLGATGQGQFSTNSASTYNSGVSKTSETLSNITALGNTLASIYFNGKLGTSAKVAQSFLGKKTLNVAKKVLK